MNELGNLNDELFQPLSAEEQTALAGGLTGHFTISASISFVGPDADLDASLDWGN